MTPAKKRLKQARRRAAKLARRAQALDLARGRALVWALLLCNAPPTKEAP